ncbi:unnamed protein product, partial [Rotaria sp. Silwood1]
HSHVYMWGKWAFAAILAGRSKT